MKRDITEWIENTLTTSGFITGLAKWLGDLMNKIFQETPLRPLKLLANGTLIEHPLHPVVTDVPVGSWTVAILLMLVTLIFGVQNLGLATGFAIGLGVLAGLAAIVTGLLDWMDVDPPELAVGITHGIINIVATIIFAIAFYLLYSGNWEINLTNTLLAVVGYLTVTVGAFIGGSLVFRQGVMINRDAYRKGPKDYTPALAAKDLADNQLKRVEVKGQPVLLLKRGEKIYAIGAVCSHYGGPLEKGKLVDGTVECPWHYSRFALEDGRVKEGPATSPMPAYDARINNGQVEVKMRQ